MKGNEESVLPLPGEVNGKCRILFRVLNKRESCGIWFNINLITNQNEWSETINFQLPNHSFHSGCCCRSLPSLSKNSTTLSCLPLDRALTKYILSSEFSIFLTAGKSKNSSKWVVETKCLIRVSIICLTWSEILVQFFEYWLVKMVPVLFQSIQIVLADVLDELVYNFVRLEFERFQIKWFWNFEINCDTRNDLSFSHFKSVSSARTVFKKPRKVKYSFTNSSICW